MVHALKKVKPWLNPNGYLIVIHDLGDPPRVEVHTKESQSYAGRLYSDDEYDSERHADQAIDLVIQEGIFTSEHSKVFENYIRADSLSSMIDWLAESWESAYITDGTRRKVQELVDLLGQESEVVLHMISRMVKLDISRDD